METAPKGTVVMIHQESLTQSYIPNRIFCNISRLLGVI